MWTNPKTGSKSFCVNDPYATVLLSIDLEALDLRTQRIVEGEQFISVRQRDGHFYAAARYSANCSLSTNVKLVEIMKNLESRTIFQTSSVNSVDVKDFEVTADHFTLVGNVQTFLPASSTRLSLKFEELGGDKQLGDAFGENIEDQLSPLVLVVGKDGALVSDRVFTGVATRAIQNVVALDSFRFVAAGLTFGERGWIMSFALQKPKGDVGSRIGTWLNGIRAGIGGSHLRER